MIANLTPLPTALALAALHLAIGTVAAWIARRKGRNFRRWLGIGWICGTPSLLAALWLSSSPAQSKVD
ncbi:MAG: hypothetical protein HC771_20120 [Synechococcales cyanobacterium CRU_2_2]|nr:hypothetical protein [Synechococcales cyanobacterium CRU_2_2]